jgi:predicted dehydrogenase
MKMLDSGDVSDHPYQTQFQAFFDALQSGNEMPLTSFTDAFATHRVMKAADTSVEEGRSVKVAEVPTD